MPPAWICRSFCLATAQAEDICVLSPGDDGIALVHPGFPQIKLRADASRRLEEDLTVLLKVRQNLEKGAA